jgi:hypothetical protein
MGARHVHAYEPVFYELAELNLRLNGVSNATVHPHGLWIEDGWLDVARAGGGTGLMRGGARIRVRPIAEALGRPTSQSSTARAASGRWRRCRARQ